MGILQSSGHAKLKQQCVKYAGELGLENFSASWAEDIVIKESILTVEAKTGTNELRFSEQEIQEYDRGMGVDLADAKIRKALQEIAD